MNILEVRILFSLEPQATLSARRIKFVNLAAAFWLGGPRL